MYKYQVGTKTKIQQCCVINPKMDNILDHHLMVIINYNSAEFLLFFCIHALLTSLYNGFALLT